MVQMYHRNVALGKGEEKELQEYYAVARYYEAASYYKIYLEKNDEDRRTKEFEKMQEAFSQMGDFSFVRDKIHKVLELEL